MSVAEPTTSPPRTFWRPLRVWKPDHELDVTVSRVYGFRGECSCGWVGPVRRTVEAVRLTIHEHRWAAH